MKSETHTNSYFFVAKCSEIQLSMLCVPPNEEVIFHLEYAIIPFLHPIRGGMFALALSDSTEGDNSFLATRITALWQLLFFSFSSNSCSECSPTRFSLFAQNWKSRHFEGDHFRSFYYYYGLFFIIILLHCCCLSSLGSYFNIVERWTLVDCSFKYWCCFCDCGMKS